LAKALALWLRRRLSRHSAWLYFGGFSLPGFLGFASGPLFGGFSASWPSLRSLSLFGFFGLPLGEGFSFLGFSFCLLLGGLLSVAPGLLLGSLSLPGFFRRPFWLALSSLASPLAFFTDPFGFLFALISAALTYLASSGLPPREALASPRRLASSSALFWRHALLFFGGFGLLAFRRQARA
jgi:hypothetical protein